MTGEYLAELSPHEREDRKREFAARILPLFENALKAAYLKRTKFSMSKMDFALDSIERYLPGEIIASTVIEETDMQMANSILSGMKRSRMLGEITERRVASFIGVLVGFLEIASDALNFLEVETFDEPALPFEPIRPEELVAPPELEKLAPPRSLLEKLNGDPG